MSKQSHANTVYNEMVTSGVTERKDIISAIVHSVQVSPAYASTLYNNAKKQFAPKAPTLPTKPSQTRAVKPSDAKSSKIDSFTKTNLREMRQALNAALESVAQQYGVDINIGNIRFSETEFRTTMTVNTKGKKDDSAALNIWKQYSFVHRMEASDFGREFVVGGERYRIVAYKPRGKRFNISAERIHDGARYKFSSDTVKRSLV